MKPEEIKADLVRKGISLRRVADLAECSPQQVTMCIKGNGLYQNVREVIAVLLGKPVNKIFNSHHPKPKRVNRSFAVV